MNDFDRFFGKLADDQTPHPWQSELAASQVLGNRLIRIPTGFGKTMGVLATWLWHRVHQGDDAWPRRLVWCLPMRVLVEQTEKVVRGALAAAGLLWEGGDHGDSVGVHLVMGGADAGDWSLYPEARAVLIGTQDMLLSRALNRGYGAARARWPAEFGLLNHDCLWVMDEVQLMDVGLATSAQLQAFRQAFPDPSPRPTVTWWMSATLQPEWIEKSPDTAEVAAGLANHRIPAPARTGPLWDGVQKPFRLEPVTSPAALARLVSREYADTAAPPKGPALVVVNTVDRALAVYDALRRDKSAKAAGTGIRLVHGRFRPADRANWAEAFLNRSECASGVNRIIVSTQVIEAGVDFSAVLLVTELAPWASLVQRFGRCARWGGDGLVIIADFAPKNDREAAPYLQEDLDAAREALTHLEDVSPRHLEAFEDRHPELLPRLFPYAPPHLLLAHELEELFDTAPDLSGADIDISRFIRTGEERDLHVFWASVPANIEPDGKLRPTRDALCAVPFLKAREWLCGKTAGPQARLKNGMRAWVWDWLDGAWRKPERRDLYPGRTVLVAADCGGYLPDRGWSPDSLEPVPPVDVPAPPFEDAADAALESEALSTQPGWQTIATHGRETGRIAAAIAGALLPSLAGLFDLAGRCHDLGKGHPAFNNTMVGPDRPDRSDLAKAPPGAWLPLDRLYPMPGEGRRAGFRHELVSVLGLFSVLRRHQPDHPALLGLWQPLLKVAGYEPAPFSDPVEPPSPIEAEILALDDKSFNLAAYLVCAHHGKARVAWHATPTDQAADDPALRIMGVKDGDKVPTVPLMDAREQPHSFPGFTIDLSIASAGLNPTFGEGWTERVLRLLADHGPFTLAWMEALFRAADQRASRLNINDDLLNPEEMP
jgi:CRISPR-associated endonuclease/helicase Cas3